MSIISAPYEFNQDDLYVDLADSFGIPLYLKCEGFNFAGSVKLKAALAMITAAEKSGALGFDSVLVESSSGNLGIALAMIAASKGLRFVCVTDARCNPASLRIMRSYGARVQVVTEPDPESGFLGARLAYVRRLCEDDSRYVWLNQYENPENWGAHHRLTAPAIAERFPEIDVLFLGTGTGGTLMGCARWFREHRPRVWIVAVDSVGSVAFGGPPGVRHIPGLGSGVRPRLLDESFVDDVLLVPEIETVRACRRLVGRGFSFGGSTGTVVAGAARWFAAHVRDGDEVTAVAVAPDLGERYLDTVYRTRWVRDRYGAAALRPAGPAGPERAAQAAQATRAARATRNPVDIPGVSHPAPEHHPGG